MQFPDAQNIPPLGRDFSRALSPFDPVIDEYNGWQEYTKLHKETGDNKYAVAGHEEFRNMLLRLSKALEKIDSMATTEAEKAELENFRKAMTT